MGKRGADDQLTKDDVSDGDEVDVRLPHRDSSAYFSPAFAQPLSLLSRDASEFCSVTTGQKLLTRQDSRHAQAEGTDVGKYRVLPIVVAGGGILQFRPLQLLPLRQLALQEVSRSAPHQQRPPLVALEPAHPPALLLLLPLPSAASRSASLPLLIPNLPDPPQPLFPLRRLVDSLLVRSLRTRRRRHRLLPRHLRLRSLRSVDSRSVRRRANPPPPRRRPLLLLPRQPSLRLREPRPLPRSLSVGSLLEHRRRHQPHPSGGRRPRDQPLLRPRLPSRVLPRDLARLSRSLPTRARSRTTPRSVV